MTGQFLAMAGVAAFSRIRVCGVFARFSGPDVAVIGRLVKLGLPIGASIFIETAMFATLSLMIGRLGAASVAAHQIAANVAGLTFMIALALGAAASVRVGYNVGAENLAASRRSGLVAIVVSVLIGACGAGAILLARHWVAALYSTDAAVVALAANLLLFVVVFQVFDNAQGTCVGALRGYKDTRTPMWIGAVAYWLVGMPLGIVCGFGLFGVPNFGLYGFWVGLTGGLMLAAVVLLLRFRGLSRNWARIRELAGS